MDGKPFAPFVTSEVNIFAAVLAFEVILAEFLLEMIVETELVAKHTKAVLAEMSMIRHTDVVAVVTFLTDVFAVVSFLYMVSLIALMAVVAATEKSGHGCN